MSIKPPKHFCRECGSKMEWESEPKRWRFSGISGKPLYCGSIRCPIHKGNMRYYKQIGGNKERSINDGEWYYDEYITLERLAKQKEPI